MAGTELWCQGYSEPGAGSDLANVKTKARFDEASGKWLINGQKVWTSLAHESDYCFVIARTDPDSVAHKGLGFFLLEMDQPGIEVRPIEQITGTSEFNEVFFDEAECAPRISSARPVTAGRWPWACWVLSGACPRWASRCSSRTSSMRSCAWPRSNGAAQDPVIRQRIAQAHAELKIMRYNSMRMLSGRAAVMVAAKRGPDLQAVLGHLAPQPG